MRHQQSNMDQNKKNVQESSKSSQIEIAILKEELKEIRDRTQKSNETTERG